ncbi:aspartic proteinase NANA, chloroplast-like [Phragmites australis]|uniref:aspartic proteinase NANA, chloroplast-like n=1 Tax=Phragmites australis TaxID=29695 RepID=UPI002D785774|nr:aspartic proteinase NANA, chloroplast-like [Phragmites australis]
MAGHPPMLLLLLAAAAALLAAAPPGASGKSMRFDLLRFEGASLAEQASADRARAASISARGRRRAAETARTKTKAAPAADAFAMPLSSGAYSGTGQYFVRFRVGTPAQPFLLVADTGSDLTWVKCRRPAPAYGAASNDSDSSSLSGSPQHGRVFRPEKSRTWAPISCASDTCKASLPFSLAACPSPGSACAYDYRYKDGSAARGTVGTDSATIALSGRAARKAKLRGVVLGCTTSYNGDSFLAADGVLSLGYSNISFASRAAEHFGGRFSYCLVDHLAPRNATSYLTFGPNPAVSSSSKTACGSSAAPGARQTPLLLDHRMHPFYAVTVNGISVDGELLKIPRLVWDVERGGGAIVDSGTSLTVLARPAYRTVVAALSKKLAGLPRVTMDPFDYCYNWTSPSSGEDLTVAVPKLAVHFAGSARLEPPSKSYVIDAAPGVKCIGVQEGEWPGVSVIGNILQQEHLWEFDLKNRRLRFKRSRCTQ